MQHQSTNPGRVKVGTAATKPLSSHSLVSEIEFLQATRDTGYQSTATAVAELVDNALQANATWVRIQVDEEKTIEGRQITLSVIDNGHGMNAEKMCRALQFGGTDRFDDRIGLGRFGMGLPNSSVSQCRRVELFSWLPGRPVLWTFLDIDEFVAGTITAIPLAKPRTLPQWISFSAEAGTLVIWKKCDRLDFRKASTITSKLTRELGQKFRHFLAAGKEIYINSQRIGPIDPLFLSKHEVLNGAEEPFPPLKYCVSVNELQTQIIVRFSLLPVTQWHSLPIDYRRKAGISGGAGVSIIRGGREIAYGWYFMGKKRRQNYDDWWRCEVSFDPTLDDWFGVTHSKQGINPRPELNAFLAPDMERIAHQLNSMVQAEFSKVRENTRSRSVRTAEDRDWLLPQLAPSRNGDVVFEPTTSQLGLRYEIQTTSMTSPHFFQWQLKDGLLTIQLNKNHPFYSSIYEPTVECGNGETQFYLECLLLAYARSEAQQARHGSREQLRSFRENWSDTLAALLG